MTASRNRALTPAELDRFGEERGNMLMRKYACCYAQGRRGARDFRALASKCSTTDEFVRIVLEHFPKDGQVHHEPEPEAACESCS